MIKRDLEESGWILKGLKAPEGFFWVKKDLPMVQKDPGGSLSAIKDPDGFLGLWRVLRGLKGSYKGPKGIEESKSIQEEIDWLRRILMDLLKTEWSFRDPKYLEGS